MAIRERKTWVIYPEYFDSKLSRGEGRRVPKKISVGSPSIDEISQVLDSFNIPNRKEKNSPHPGHWTADRGRIIISKQNVQKQKFLKGLGKKIKQKRSS
ncbi:MAG: signal recognition particle subunit SRP19/SEC65 family protein [Thermoplasmatota archaeon]